MTTHDDLEARLRATLRDRAGDVETTPALYEEVQRRANRGAWLWRGVALAGAVAAVTVAVVVVPSLLPDPQLDIADTPQEAVPTADDGPTVDAAPELVPAQLAAQLFESGVAYAVDDGRGGSVLQVGGRTIPSAQPIVSLDAASSGASTALVVGFADGSLAGVDVGAAGDAFDQVVDADANGAKAVVTPGVDGVAWIEGTDLHVLPLSDGAAVRVLPLEGDVPDDLEIEDWTAQSDAQVILASEPDGTVWRIPMDDSNVSNTAPTEPASVLDDAAVDAVVLADLTQVALHVPGAQARASLVVGQNVIGLGDQVDSVEAELAGNGQFMTLLDPSTTIGTLLNIAGDGTFDDVLHWEDTAITAAAPLGEARAASGPDAPEEQPQPEEGNASELGLPTGSPLIGTAGTDLLLRFADGEVRTLPLYPSAESEASLGRLAVMPGSTTEYGLVAVESSSEGENSIRFGGLRDGEVGPVGDIIVVDGPVTGLVWSEDGRELAWTDTAGLHVAAVDDTGSVTGEELLHDDARPVLDWVWDEVGATASGHLTVAVAGGTGVEQVGVERSANGALGVIGPAGGSDRLMLDVHTDVGTAEDVEVVAALGGGTAELSWVAAGNRFGSLPDPGVVGGDVRVAVSGGHVLVMGDNRQVLVTFDGEVVDLPAAADWDVLD